MKSIRRPGIKLLAVVGAVALAAAACGGGSSSPTSTNNGPNSASAPGVTATTVTIGSTQPLTGPAAPGFSEIAPAAKAYFQYVNDHGGVNGRKIDFKFLDDGYDPTKTSTLTRQLVLQDKVFAMFDALGTPTHSAVVDFLNAQKVPDLSVASGCICWNEPQQHPYTFGYQTDYTVEGKILGQYVKEHYAGQKVGYFYQNDDFGQNGVKGLDMYIPKSQVVSRQTYTTANADISAQIAALKAAGAQVIVSFSIPPFTALARLGALKLNYSPQFVVSTVGSDPSTLTGLLKQIGGASAGASLINGMVTDGYLSSLGDTSNSWIALFKKIHDQYDASAPFDGNVEFGMGSASTFVKALQAAGKNPTRASIVKAYETADLSGPGLTPFRYSPTVHAGYAGVQVGIIQNGAVNLVGTPLVTDDGSGPITPYTKGQAAAPANGVS